MFIDIVIHHDNSPPPVILLDINIYFIDCCLSSLSYLILPVILILSALLGISILKQILIHSYSWKVPCWLIWSRIYFWIHSYFSL